MIDENKQYKTRDGRYVRIYCTDAGGNMPVHGALESSPGLWVQERWCSNGTIHGNGGESNLDLIEVKNRIKKTLWLNVYWHTGYAYPSKLAADKNRNDNCLAIVEVNIDCEEGHGIECDF